MLGSLRISSEYFPVPFLQSPCSLSSSNSSSFLSSTSELASPSRHSTPPPHPPMRKRVSWSRFHQVKLNDEVFLLPGRYINPEPLDALNATMCTALDISSDEVVVIKKIDLSNIDALRKALRNMYLSRHIQHANFLSIQSAFEAENHLYILSDQMDGLLGAVEQERTNHYVLARLMHQLLSAVATLHSNRLSHRGLHLNTIFVDTDAALRLSSYGESDGAKEENTVEGMRSDLIALGDILSFFLLHDGALNPLIAPKSHKKLDWRPITNGSVDSGLTDDNARNVMWLLLGGVRDAASLLHHPYFSSFPLPDIRVDSGFTMPLLHTMNQTELLKLLREELTYFEAL